MDVLINSSFDRPGMAVLLNSSLDHRNHGSVDEDTSLVDYPGGVKYKPLWEMIVKTVFYVPVIVFALIGNVIVIAVVAKNKRMQTTTNYYIVNLAVADCLIALTCTWSHLVDDLTPFWVLGKFCTFNTFSQVLSLVASIFTLTFIACDRFFGIVFAMKAHFIERRATCSILLIWLLSLLVASPLIFYRRLTEWPWRDVVEVWCDDHWPLEIYTNPETGLSESISLARRFYYMFVCVVLFFLPCLVMGLAYLIIILTLWSAQVPGERISKDIKSQAKMRKKVVIMLVVILAVFVLCWMPLVVSIIYAEFVHKQTKEMAVWFEHFYYFARYLAHFNSVLNPFIYAGFNDNFKKEFLNMCGAGKRPARYNTMVSRVDSFQSSTHVTKL